MAKGIVLVDEAEISRRVAREIEIKGMSVTDPIAHIKSLVEKIADEGGVVSSVTVSSEGRQAVRFYARVDVKKLAAMRRSAVETRQS